MLNMDSNSQPSFVLLFWFPSSGGDLNGEVGRGEEGEDLGSDVVAAVVNALAE